jgi:hypothetical protein
LLADDDLIAQADALLSKPWSPPSIDDTCPFGKHKGRTYRDMARIDPGYAKWVATTIPGIKGQLCAEALAVHLGVDE